MDTSEVVVVGGSFVEGTGEVRRSLRSAEKEAATPQNEYRQANGDGEHHTDQHTDQNHRVFLRLCSVQVQATDVSVRQRHQILPSVFRWFGTGERVNVISH